MNRESESEKEKLCSRSLIDDSISIRENNILTEYQQDELNKLKTQIKRENKEYLKEHPEITMLLEMFLIDILNSKPSRDNVISAAADFFNRPLVDLKKEIQKHSSLKNLPLPEELSYDAVSKLPSLQFSHLNILSTDLFPSETTANLSVLTENDEKTSESTITIDDEINIE